MKNYTYGRKLIYYHFIEKVTIRENFDDKSAGEEKEF